MIKGGRKMNENDVVLTNQGRGRGSAMAPILFLTALVEIAGVMAFSVRADMMKKWEYAYGSARHVPTLMVLGGVLLMVVGVFLLIQGMMYCKSYLWVEDDRLYGAAFEGKRGLSSPREFSVDYGDIISIDQEKKNLIIVTAGERYLCRGGPLCGELRQEIGQRIRKAKG